MSEGTMTVEAAPAPAPAAEVSAPVSSSEATMTAEAPSVADSIVNSETHTETNSTESPSVESEDFSAWEAELTDTPSGIITLDVISPSQENSSPSHHLEGMSEINVNAASINEGPVSATSLQNSVDYQIPGLEDTQPGNVQDAAPDTPPANIITMDVITQADVQESVTEEDSMPETAGVPVTVANPADVTEVSATPAEDTTQLSVHASEPQATPTPEAIMQPDTQSLNVMHSDRMLTYVPTSIHLASETSAQPIIEPADTITEEVTTIPQAESMDTVTETNATHNTQVINEVPTQAAEVITPDVSIETYQEERQTAIREELLQIATEQQQQREAGEDISIQADMFLQKVTVTETPWVPKLEPTLLEETADPKDLEASRMLKVKTVQNQTVSQGTALLHILEEREKNRKKLLSQEQGVSHDFTDSAIINKVRLRDKTQEDVLIQTQIQEDGLLIMQLKSKMEVTKNQTNDIKYKVDTNTQDKRVNAAAAAAAMLKKTNDPKEIISADKVIALLEKPIICQLAKLFGLKYDGSHEKMKQIIQNLGDGTAKQITHNVELATELSPAVMIADTGKDVYEDDVERVVGKTNPYDKKLGQDQYDLAA